MGDLADRAGLLSTKSVGRSVDKVKKPLSANDLLQRNKIRRCNPQHANSSPADQPEASKKMEPEGSEKCCGRPTLMSFDRP